MQNVKCSAILETEKNEINIGVIMIDNSCSSTILFSEGRQRFIYGNGGNTTYDNNGQ